MIGDGMGREHVDAASLYAHGARGRLFMESLPYRGRISTAGPSGITDSAAAATVMATGTFTYNAHVGVDRTGEPLETLVERAKAGGLATGIVTSAYLPHATPGAFSAHHQSRHDSLIIAEQQARDVQPDVLMGGGAQFYRPAGAGSLRGDEGLIAPLEDAGYKVVYSENELRAAAPQVDKIVGLFADEHLDYVIDREATSSQPSLSEMSMAALEVLERDPEGFFLMIEGARIDMASHANDAERAITETVDFDRTVEAVARWAAERDEVTLIVTADHECGGLTLESESGTGEIPAVSWRWGAHTNDAVDVFASGPLAEVFEGEIRDHRWIFQAALAQLQGAPFAEPPPLLRVDGRLGDLRYQVASQAVPSAFGPLRNRLDSLSVDADADGLYLGVEGIFEWEKNAVVALLDRDFGAGTGVASLKDALSDREGALDSILSSLPLSAPPVSGFGAELAIASVGGADIHLEELSDTAGLRALAPPRSSAGNLGWDAAVVNFAEGVRSRGPIEGVPGQGMEIFVPWTSIYPETGGSLPAGAKLALAIVLANDDGSHLSNQALPPLAGRPTNNPGPAGAPLPEPVVIPLDVDGDGALDAELAPHLLSGP